MGRDEPALLLSSAESLRTGASSAPPLRERRAGRGRARGPRTEVVLRVGGNAALQLVMGGARAQPPTQRCPDGQTRGLLGKRAKEPVRPNTETSPPLLRIAERICCEKYRAPLHLTTCMSYRPALWNGNGGWQPTSKLPVAGGQLGPPFPPPAERLDPPPLPSRLFSS